MYLKFTYIEYLTDGCIFLFLLDISRLLLNIVFVYEQIKPNSCLVDTTTPALSTCGNQSTSNLKHMDCNEKVLV